ncbi:Lipoprotein E precursor, partial [Haemophilus influenzae]
VKLSSCYLTQTTVAGKAV